MISLLRYKPVGQLRVHPVPSDLISVLNTITAELDLPNTMVGSYPQSLAISEPLSPS